MKLIFVVHDVKNKLKYCKKASDVALCFEGCTEVESHDKIDKNIHWTDKNIHWVDKNYPLSGQKISTEWIKYPLSW